MTQFDHCINNNTKTLKVLDEERRVIEALSEEQKKDYRLDPLKFNPLRLAWIQDIYADMGKEMITLLSKNPVKAIPIITERLKQRQNQWVGNKEECLQGWKEQAERNFYKSLDIRSFAFKQYEKKNENSKTYMLELKNT